MDKRLISLGVVLSVLLAGVAAAAPASPNDPYLELQWGLRMIHAQKAWSSSDGTGSLIAIVDSGIDASHPDLAGKVVKQVFDPCNGQGLERSDSHGTEVAGIAAAATNNSIGIAGVAPGARILDVKVLPEAGGCAGQTAAKGIRFAVDQGADVINVSIVAWRGATLLRVGGIPTSGSLNKWRRALRYAYRKGAVVVGIAGNDRLPFCAEPWHGAPALCVGAVNSLGGPTGYTGYDATSQSNFLVAPGGEGPICETGIVTTIPIKDTSYEFFCGHLMDPGYGAPIGTSMAAPHVSGVAALLAAKGLTGPEIIECLLETAQDLGAPGRDPIFGHGLVDARNALRSC